MTFINILYRGRRMCVGVSALMRRCEFQGLYFQTKFFSNHSQLFSCWSTLRCYVKTLRKDQRIINWKSLDRISTCQFKCMWPQSSVCLHTLRHLNLACCFVSGTFPQLTQITGFHSLIIRAGRYQEPGLASAVWCHMCHFHSHTDTQRLRPREGTDFKFKSPLWPSHQLPLTLFEFQSNDAASPFF